MYLKARQDELTDWTLESHKYQLRAFVKQYEELGVDDLTELDSRDLYEFRVWRRERNFGMENGEMPKGIVPVTFGSQLTTPRAFLRFAANIHAIPEGFYERVPLPKLSRTDGVGGSTLEPDQATDVLKYLRRYHYASRRHVEFALLWETGAQMGAIRDPDLRNLDLNSRASVVRYRHRPDQGMPIKNDERGERFNLVSDRVGTVLQAYTDGPCVDKTDESGRRPLLTTSHGRASTSTIRQDVYVVTRPCQLNQGCPYNRDIEACEAVELNHVSTCPSSRSLYDVRKGVVTLYRQEEVPRRVVSNRLDASDLALSKHYDRRGEHERTEQRRNRLPRQNNECSTYPNARGGLYTPFTEPLQHP